jgi:hypothetical protein
VRGFVANAQGTGAVMTSCLTCGKPIRRGQSYCGKHRPVRDVRARGGGAAILAFRNAVGERAGWQCEAIEDGERCAERHRPLLEAHHVGGVAEHNDAMRGLLLCRHHHRVIEAAARKQRAALSAAQRLSA